MKDKNVYFYIPYLQKFLTFLAGHIILTIISSFLLGLVLGVTTYGTIYYRRERRLKRFMALFQSSLVDSLEITTLTSRFKLQQHGGLRHSRNVLNVQAPAARATEILNGETVQANNEELIYYFPETPSAAMPMGIQTSRGFKLVFGNPVSYFVPLKLFAVNVRDEAGVWYPAIIESRTGLSVLRHTLKRQLRNTYWLQGFRNLYICDFIGKGEPLGSITPPVEKAKPLAVTAPRGGFILTFEALAYTPLALGANTMFLGVPKVLKRIEFEGDRPGRFEYPDEQNSPVGKIIETGTVLCIVTSLGFPQEVTMPETGLIVRQHKEPGDVVLYRDANLKNELLFQYVALEKPLEL